MHHDGKPSMRENASKGHIIVALSANGHNSKLYHDPLAAAADQRSNCSNHLLSKQYLVFWLLWLLLCGCFAIRHSTRLLDAAGQQHHLLQKPPVAVEASSLSHSNDHQQHPTSSSAHTNSSNMVTGVSAAATLAAQQAKWPDGYVAICAVIKDQWPDLRYWIEYHKWLGVSKFYIYDNNSTLPALLILWDYLKQGIVEYEYFLGRPRRRKDFTDTNQYRAYQSCLLQHFKQHRWIAFIDADEFFVFPEQPHSNSSSASASANQSNSPLNGADSILHPSQQDPGLQQTEASAEDQHHGLVNQHGAVITQETVTASADAAHSIPAAASAVPQTTAAGSVGQDGLLPAAGAVNTTALGAAASTASTGSTRPSSGGLLNSSTTDQDSISSSHGQDIAVFLSQYESHPAVGVNWVLFGSSGHLTRPSAGPLASYTACVSQSHWESTHVKVIANTGGILGLGYTPHEVITRPGRSIVDVDHKPFRGPKTPQAKWHKLVLHHYVVKSKAEFVSKKTRGSGAGNFKGWPYFSYVENLSNHTCTRGLAVSEAFLATQPQLALPKAARVVDGCHQKAAAAYEALLRPTQEGPEQEQKQQATSRSSGQVVHSTDGISSSDINEWLLC